MDLVQLWWIIWHLKHYFQALLVPNKTATISFFYTAFITSEPANLTMPDTADPAETLGLIKGLAEVVKSQHSAHKAEQEAHLKAMKATNEHISNLTATVEGLSKQIQNLQQPIFKDYAYLILFSLNIWETALRAFYHPNGKFAPFFWSTL